jgi:hypothetical protein
MRTPSTRVIARFAKAFFCICGASACSASPGHIQEETSRGLPARADAGTADAGALAEGLPAPATAAGRQLAWVLEAINLRRGAIEEAELRAHFSPRFLPAGPVAGLQATLQFFAFDMAPLTILEIEMGASESQLRAVLDGLYVRVRVSIDLDPVSGLMDDLQLAEQADLGGGYPTTWEAVESTLASLGARTSYLLARADDGRCEPVRGIDFEQRLAIATTSNLYVLAALAGPIEAGSVTWDTTVMIRDALKSPPPGELRNLPEGTPVSVLDLATQMISRADGTATDHLIDLLGRETIEGSLGAAGHGAPELNTPFLSTREFNLLKLNLGDVEVETYLAGDVAAKRAFLDGLAGRMAQRSFTPEALRPRRIDQIEWFASAAELCQVMSYLDTLAERQGLSQIRDVLSINSYLDIDREAFPYVAYQGGAEPGVRHMSWLVRNREGERYFVSVGVNDPEVWIPMYSYLTTPLGIFAVLARE